MDTKPAQIRAAIEQIEARAFAARLPISHICRRVGVAPSTFSRWRAGAVEPKGDTIDKLFSALDTIEAERAAA